MAAQVIGAGTGRRKTSTARVRLMRGAGKVTVNGREFEEFFPREIVRRMIVEPLKLINKLGEFDIAVNVKGGGISGQAGAVRHGISRALLQVDASFRDALKKEGFLTRDSRMVERKKPGQPKARKKFQFSKR
ncbi:MAG: 30S ribosomal protein S9 [Candidatus Muiribacterium halophilum]|uniref:Small ribosomal subunit protein uS9 n=1 Tax=Muiribacterium halophilum TaxID=2053465 RepID=A0A2N5ZFB3_MUIH1|nr:MAG: 30S ribosomal protein S9 [Candidatus Muirbacterium halophilum]